MSIEEFNKYNEWKTIKIVPSLIVKKGKKDNKTFYYVVVAQTLEKCKDIVAKQELSLEVYDILNNTENLPIPHEVEAVSFWGNLKKFKHYEKLVYQFPYRKRDMLEKKERRFRLYTASLETQKESAIYINLCNNAKDSWLSVLKKIGSEYGLILKVTVCQ